jgi:hypothetical protein
LREPPEPPTKRQRLLQEIQRLETELEQEAAAEEELEQEEATEVAVVDPYDEDFIAVKVKAMEVATTYSRTAGDARRHWQDIHSKLMKTGAPP